jgi:hypothetical protein
MDEHKVYLNYHRNQFLQWFHWVLDV